jgi:hypothetical protein
MIYNPPPAINLKFIGNNSLPMDPKFIERTIPIPLGALFNGSFDLLKAKTTYEAYLELNLKSGEVVRILMADLTSPVEPEYEVSVTYLRDTDTSNPELIQYETVRIEFKPLNFDVKTSEWGGGITGSFQFGGNVQGFTYDEATNTYWLEASVPGKGYIGATGYLNVSTNCDNGVSVPLSYTSPWTPEFSVSLIKDVNVGVNQSRIDVICTNGNFELGLPNLNAFQGNGDLTTAKSTDGSGMFYPNRLLGTRNQRYFLIKDFPGPETLKFKIPYNIGGGQSFQYSAEYTVSDTDAILSAFLEFAFDEVSKVISIFIEGINVIGSAISVIRDHYQYLGTNLDPQTGICSPIIIVGNSIIPVALSVHLNSATENRLFSDILFTIPGYSITWEDDAINVRSKIKIHFDDYMKIVDSPTVHVAIDSSSLDYFATLTKVSDRKYEFYIAATSFDLNVKLKVNYTTPHFNFTPTTVEKEIIIFAPPSDTMIPADMSVPEDVSPFYVYYDMELVGGNFVFRFYSPHNNPFELETVPNFAVWIASNSTSNTYNTNTQLGDGSFVFTIERASIEAGGVHRFVFTSDGIHGTELNIPSSMFNGALPTTLSILSKSGPLDLYTNSYFDSPMIRDSDAIAVGEIVTNA